MKIVLPWPSPKLSPNARLHWRARVGPKQSAKIAAGWATVAASGFHDARLALAQGDSPIPVTITFYPPDNRRRDDDNMIASFKAARDGIADALGVDDCRFRATYVFAEPERPGRVEVILCTKSLDLSISGESRAIEKGGADGALTPNPPLNINASEER